MKKLFAIDSNAGNAAPHFSRRRRRVAGNADVFGACDAKQRTESRSYHVRSRRDNCLPTDGAKRIAMDRCPEALRGKTIDAFRLGAPEEPFSGTSPPSGPLALHDAETLPNMKARNTPLPTTANRAKNLN